MAHLHWLSLALPGVSSCSCQRVDHSQSRCRFPCRKPSGGTPSLNTWAKEKSSIRQRNPFDQKQLESFKTGFNSYISNCLEDVVHSQRNHPMNTVAPHHGEGLSRRSLPVSKYGSCGSNATTDIHNKHTATKTQWGNTIPPDKSPCTVSMTYHCIPWQ